MFPLSGKIFFVALSLFGVCSVSPTFSGEMEAVKLSGDAAYEFFMGMTPPLNRGDWAAFEQDGRKSTATITETDGEGAEKRLTIEIQNLDDAGNPADSETRSIVPSEAIRAMVDKHDYLIISPVTASIKDKSIQAAQIRGFRDDKPESEFTISVETPLGEIARRHGDSEATLIDFGWGDEAYDPMAIRLSFAEAYERIAATLPEPNAGEWCEYFAPDIGEGIINRYRIVCGVDGRDGGRMLSKYGIPDEDGHPIEMGRLTVDETREEYGESVFNNMGYFTISNEVVSVKGEKKAVMTLNAFNRGLCGARIRLSAELPYPWLAEAVLIAEEGDWSGLRLVDWGWESPEDIGSREHRAMAEDAIAEVVDAGLDQAAIGDWALYEKLDGGKVRYELVEILAGSRLPRYMNLIREFDAAGAIIKEERKTNTRDEILNGYILSGDVRADRLDLSRSETTIMGESIPVLSKTGFQEDKPVYRVDLSSRVPATQLVNLVVFPFSPEPFWKLTEFGKR